MQMTKFLIDGAVSGHIFSRGEAEAVMEELLAGQVATADIVRLLTAMNARPVRVEELAGFASVMRRQAARVFRAGEPRMEHLVDTCGTGGKGFGSFNISTAAAIVAAAAGARVAKHGNRASHSGSGSADVMEAIGVRTVFNLLGPLTNPAGARAQVVGVPSPDLIDLVAETLAELGVEHAFVVHGAGGLDEISLAGETLVAEIKGGGVERFAVTPEDFGVSRAPIDSVRGGT